MQRQDNPEQRYKLVAADPGTAEAIVDARRVGERDEYAATYRERIADLDGSQRGRVVTEGAVPEISLRAARAELEQGPGSAEAHLSLVVDRGLSDDAPEVRRHHEVEEPAYAAAIERLKALERNGVEAIPVRRGQSVADALEAARREGEREIHHGAREAPGNGHGLKVVGIMAAATGAERDRHGRSFRVGQTAESFAAELLAKHGPAEAVARAHALGYGFDSADAKKCDHLAAEGNERVLQARVALITLREMQEEQQQAMHRGRSR